MCVRVSFRVPTGGVLALDASRGFWWVSEYEYKWELTLLLLELFPPLYGLYYVRCDAGNCWEMYLGAQVWSHGVLRMNSGRDTHRANMPKCMVSLVKP